MAVYRVIDPGAPAWQTEPEFALEHAIVFNEKSLPIWNPFSGYGTPLLANMQSQPLSPIAWPIIVSNRALTYDLWIVFRFIVGALLSYAYCRQFFESFASFCGGLLYGFCGYFILYLAMPETSVHVVVPALLLAIELFARRNSVLAIVGVAISVALTIVGGMPESAFLAFCLSALYAVARVTRFRVALRDRLCALLAIGFGGILGLGISAAALFPFIEYLGQAETMHGVESIVGMQSDPFSLSTLVTYVSPLLFGPPYNNIFEGFSNYVGIRGYFGTAASVLALAAMFDWRRQPIEKRTFPRAFFSVIFILLICKRYGVPGAQLLGTLPIFHQIILFKYDEPIMALCVAFLAAYAVDQIAKSSIFFAPLLVGAVAVLSLLTSIVSQQRSALARAPEHVGYFYGSMTLSLAIIAFILLIGILQRTIGLASQYAACAVSVVVVLSSLGSYFVPLYYVVDKSAARSESALLGAPYLSPAKRLLSDGRRFFSPDHVLYPEWSAAFEIPDVRAMDALYDGRYLPFLRTFLQSGDPLFLTERFVGATDMDFANPMVRKWIELSAIGAIATETTLPLSSHIVGSPNYRLAYRDAAVNLYRVPNTLSIISGFAHVRYASSGDAALAAISNPSFDPLTTVVVEANRELTTHFTNPARFVAGHIQRNTSTMLRATIDVPREEIVLDDSTDYPGWVAFVDGKNVPILHANYLFRAVVVPAGKHVIEFRYEPASVSMGIIVTFFSLSIATLLILVASVRRLKTIQ